ncbi:MAG: hypothetical protein U0804_20270 [Gemmataceae bacterium]
MRHTTPVLPRHRVRLERLEDRTNPNVHTWIDAGLTHDWSDAFNWDTTSAPASGDDVVFNTADPNNNQDLVGRVLRSLTFNAGSDVGITLVQNLGINGSLTTNNVIDNTGLNDIGGAGNLDLASSTVYFVTNAATGRLRISADVTGTVGLRKLGVGTLELATDTSVAGHTGNTYTGATTIAAGRLRLVTNTSDDGLSTTITVGDGSGAAGSAELELVNITEIPDTADITVRSDGLLHVLSTAYEDVATLTINPGGQFTPPLLGGGGVGLQVSGTVSVNGAVLLPTAPGASVIGQEYMLIRNLGTDPVVGTFAGLPEGGGLLVGGLPYSISYRGGTGNDVVLTRLVELPRAHLAATGTDDGAALVYRANAVGHYTAAPVTVGAFGGLGTNVRATTADVNGDTFVDTILVTGPGTPLRMAVVSGVDNVTLLVTPTAPFTGSEDFTGGGFVAAADLDGDGEAEWVVTPDEGGGPRVTVFAYGGGMMSVRANFLGIDDANFRGGCRAAVGDVNADHVPDMAVAAGFLGGPRVAVFDGATLFGTPTRMLNDFFAFPGADAVNLRNGAYVAVGDVNRDGFADLVFGGGPGGAPRVFILPGDQIAAGNVDVAQSTPIANFFVAGDAANRGGLRVAVNDADDDGRADVLAGSGEGSAARVRSYLGVNFTTTGEPAVFEDLAVFGGVPLAGGVFVG